MMTGLAAGVSVGFDQPGITVMPGEVITADFTLDAAPAGISGFAIGIRVEDPSIGEITEVTLPGGLNSRTLPVFPDRRSA